jgi:hypothetical protein
MIETETWRESTLIRLASGQAKKGGEEELTGLPPIIRMKRIVCCHPVRVLRFTLARPQTLRRKG